MHTYEPDTQEGTALEASQADSRPEECSCLSSFEDLPCWVCYQAGFETPNPDPDEEPDN